MAKLKIWEEYVLHAGFMNYTATAIVKLLSQCDIYVDEEMVIQCFEKKKKRFRIGVALEKTCVGASLLGARTVFYFLYMDASSIHARMRALGYEISLPEINGLISSFHKLEATKNSMKYRPDPEYILQAYALGFTVEEIWAELKGLGDGILKTDIKRLSRMIENWMIKEQGFTKETVPTIRRNQNWNPLFERWIELTAELGLFSNYTVTQILASGYSQVSNNQINVILDTVEKRINKRCDFSKRHKASSTEERRKRPRLK